jgi:hypothetical protein
MYDDGSSRPLLSECLEEIGKCDIFILILGNRIGSDPTYNSKKTFIESEYDKAMECNKTVFRFILKPFNESLCDDIDKFQKFAHILQPLPMRVFSDLEEFKGEFLSALITLMPVNDQKLTAKGIKILEEKVSTIDREEQVSEFQLKFDNSPGEKVFYYFYFSLYDDFSHLLNFRISNLELRIRKFRFDKEQSISLEGLFLSDDILHNVQAFVNEIARKTFGLKGNKVYSIESLYKCLETEKEFKHLMIPVKICCNLEIDNKTLLKICELLRTFSLPQNIDLLKEKKVIFLLNFEFTSDDAMKENLDTIVNLMNYSDLHASNLKKLKMITGQKIADWICANFDSNPVNAKKYLQQYFALTIEDSTRMANIAEEAEVIIKEKIIKNT